MGDNELQLLCKYLWDPIQQNHLKKKQLQQKREYQQSDTTDSDISPNHSPKRTEIISRQSPKSISSKSNTLSPKNMQYLQSPNSKQSGTCSVSLNNGNSPRNVPLQFQQNISATSSMSGSS